MQRRFVGEQTPPSRSISPPVSQTLPPTSLKFVRVTAGFASIPSKHSPGQFIFALASRGLGAGRGACPACRGRPGQQEVRESGFIRGRESHRSSRTGYTHGDWACKAAHATGRRCTRSNARLGRDVLVRPAQKGKKASSYTTTGPINQCCRRTVKQYDVASIIDGNPSSRASRLPSLHGPLRPASAFQRQPTLESLPRGMEISYPIASANIFVRRRFARARRAASLGEAACERRKERIEVI